MAVSASHDDGRTSDQHSWARYDAFFDGVADGKTNSPGTAGIAHGRGAAGKRGAGMPSGAHSCLRDRLALTNLFGLWLRAVPYDMNVRVDKSRQDRNIAEIAYLRTAWRVPGRDHLENALALDQDGGVMAHRSATASYDPCTAVSNYGHASA